MTFREYNQNFIMASSSRLMEILFVSKQIDHPVVIQGAIQEGICQGGDYLGAVVLGRSCPTGDNCPKTNFESFIFNIFTSSGRHF
jgi:hypothetical protein